VIKDILAWIYEVVIDKDVNTMTLEEYRQRWSTVPHFTGLTRYPQGVDMKGTLNGRDYVNIAKQIVVVTMGGIGDTLEKSIRSIVNFMYCAMLPAHTASTVGWMKEFILEYSHTRQVRYSANYRAS
jgi:hypothetical protein